MNTFKEKNISTYEEELFYAIAFSMYKEVGEKQKVKMLRFYKSAFNIFKYLKKNNSDWPLIKAEAELKFIDKNAIQCFSILNAYYPNRLANISDPPNLLFLKGSDHFNLPQLISIVGTRQHTFQVKKVVTELLEGLTHLKIGVVSGLALGVDGIAHQAALTTKLPTWGVLAHGLDTIYPNEHRGLAIKMLQNNGGLITECLSKTPTMTFQFPKRNRIVAGMSDATIVIESDLKGGSMISANVARGYDREVFAVPGKIHDSKSTGCLYLIQNNIATMYHSPLQLLEDMHWPLPNEQKIFVIKPMQKNIILDPIAKCIYMFIQTQGPIHVDIIASQLAITSSELASYLLQLELNGHIQLLAGNLYLAT